jgi:hypothetical protein
MFAWLVLKVDSITLVSSFMASLDLAFTTLLLASRYHADYESFSLFHASYAPTVLLRILIHR